MKKVNLLWLLTILLYGLHAQWTPLNSGTSSNLSFITQNSASSLFVGSKDEAGLILKSDDAGGNWYQVLQHHSGFSNMVFTTSNTGLAIPQTTDSLFKSIDGGNSWSKQYALNCNGPFRGFPEVFFTDANTGYAPGYKTTDGGNLWFSQFPAAQSFPYMPTGITFINDSTGFIVGYEYWGAIAKTTDRGSTWTWVNTPNNTWEIYSTHFPTTNIGYCTSYKYSAVHESEIIKTIDGGDHWASIYTTTLASLFYSIHCTDANTCYVVGKNGNIAKTTDGGFTWNSQLSGTTQTLRKVFFIDENTGYAIGDSGTILKTTNGGGLTTIDKPKENSASVFPNPSQGIFIFEISSDCELEVYNIWGEKILAKFLVKGVTEIDLSTYPSNLYFYKLKNQTHFFQTGKLLKN